MRRRLRYGLSALAGVAIAAGAVATAATAIPAHNNNDPLDSLTSTVQSLAGSLPTWATPSRVVGTLDPSQKLPIKLALPLRNAGQAEQLVNQLSDPSSPNYRKYLSAKQFNSQFAPNKQDVQKVTSWLKQKGLSVQGSTDANNHYVAATGTVSQIQKAFSTTLKRYKVDGQTVKAPSTAIKLPGNIINDVTAVLGLDDSTKFIPSLANAPGTNVVRPADESSAVCPSGTPRAWNERNPANDNPATPRLRKHESETFCPYTPAQIRSAYGLRGATGAGQTVAIVDAYDSATLSVDANKYFANYGLPQLTSANFIHKHEAQKDDPSCTADDHAAWATEQALDIEAVHTTAPDATIEYYGSANCTDLFGPLNSIVANKSASIISNSYEVDNQDSLPASIRNSYNNILLQAAAEGIGVYFSTGDYGDKSLKSATGTESRSPVAVFPATSPYATAVGGTTLGIDSSGKRVFETGWETRLDEYTNGKWQALSGDTDYPKGFMGGAGGGLGTGFTTPSWQAGAVGKAYSRGYRTTPDVAALADPSTGIVEGYTPRGAGNKATGPYQEIQEGGTSLAAPLVAGIVADAQHVQHRNLGFLNPALYKAMGTSKLLDTTHVDSGIYIGPSNLAGNPILLEDFDIKVATQQSHAGWDNVTGTGVPNGAAFLSGIGK